MTRHTHSSIAAELTPVLGAASADNVAKAWMRRHPDGRLPRRAPDADYSDTPPAVASSTPSLPAVPTPERDEAALGGNPFYRVRAALRAAPIPPMVWAITALICVGLVLA